MSKLESALDRVIFYHPKECVALAVVEDKEGLKAELEEIFRFFTEREIRQGDKTKVITHVNYGGVARTWYSSTSGRFHIDVDSLATFQRTIVRLARLGVPLQLVECREKLELFSLYLDVDIKLSESVNAPSEIEKEILDEKTGFRFFKIIARIVNIVYPDMGELLVFSATGGAKVSFRLVFPSVVVDKDRAVTVREFLVQKLFNLSREESTVPFVRTFQKRLLLFSPSNHYRNVIDETAIRCRHGVRMIFNDKIEGGKGAGRIFRPLFSLKGVVAEEKLEGLEVSRIPVNSEEDDLWWLQTGSLVTPSLSHAKLSDWKRPNVRSSRVTRTGPGGSSLALTNMTTSDAVKAASRFDRAGAPSSSSVSCQFDWPVGTVALFKRRIPPGIDAELETGEGGSITWRLTKRRSNWISFNEATKVLEASAASADMLRQMTRIVDKFPQVTKRTLVERAPQLAIVEKPKERVFRVLKDFSGQAEEGELTIVQGELLVLLSTDDSGWAAVRRLASGEQGYVPGTYIKEADDVTEL